jgi:hypothetical protein
MYHRSGYWVKPILLGGDIRRNDVTVTQGVDVLRVQLSGVVVVGLLDVPGRVLVLMLVLGGTILEMLGGGLLPVERFSEGLVELSRGLKVL